MALCLLLFDWMLCLGQDGPEIDHFKKMLKKYPTARFQLQACVQGEYTIHTPTLESFLGASARPLDTVIFQMEAKTHDETVIIQIGECTTCGCDSPGSNAATRTIMKSNKKL